MPAADSIQNPILPGFNPDPSIVRDGEDFYIATSTFEWFPGVQIHHSKDLVNWRLCTRPLDRVTQLDMRGVPDSGGIWAPCLSHSDGLFHLIYTNVVQRDRLYMDMHNYLLTAPSIEGPWSEPVHLVSGGFDPSMFHDDDGRKWLVWCMLDTRPRKDRADKMNVFGGIALQEYDPKTEKLIGKPTMIFDGTELGATEGPHLYKRDGYYYLMVAEGGTGMGHAVTMARSKNIEGPYEVDPQNPMLSSRFDDTLAIAKAGHASLVELKDGQCYLTHLCGRPEGEPKGCALGRETSIQKCEWSADGWLRLTSGGSTPEITVPAPGLPAHAFEQPAERDDFDSTELSLEYQSVRIPFDESWISLSDRPGWLRIRGQESPASRMNQSIVGRRASALPSEAITCVEFEPEGFQDFAGLGVYYNAGHNYCMRIHNDDTVGKALVMVKVDKSVAARPQPVIPIDWEGPVYLKATLNAQSIEFFYSKDGESWTSTGEPQDTFLVTDEYTMGFTGTFFALFAHDQTGNYKHADFDWFTVRAINEVH